MKSPGVSYEKIAMLSGVLMANYSYKGRYLLKASMRADGSSKFSPDNRWGIFPVREHWVGEFQKKNFLRMYLGWRRTLIT